MEKQAFDEWAVVEILGRQRIAGRVTEQVIAGQGFIRIDVPELPELATFQLAVPGFTQFVGPGSVYRLTPVTEDVARGLAASIREMPVRRYELPALPPGALAPSGSDACDDDDDNDYLR